MLRLKNERVDSELNQFNPRLKSAKNRFQLSTGLNYETALNTILSMEQTIFEPHLKFKPRPNFLKFVRPQFTQFTQFTRN